jgi:DNA-directed RNA polymerase I subunit RPA2
MEDACIINKSSYERGFGSASVYKTVIVDLSEEGRGVEDAGRYTFHNTYVKGEPAYRDKSEAGRVTAAEAQVRPRVGDLIAPSLDGDGLPPIGARIENGEPLYVVFDRVSGTHRIARHKEIEPVYVDEIRILGLGGGSGHSNAAASSPGIQQVSFKLRFNRNPVVGDKFSSRHGQKGVLSFLWPSTDMPFSDSGISPDILINPHAFPSRMTIGMLVESMAGKIGSLRGEFQDATPFRFSENEGIQNTDEDNASSTSLSKSNTEHIGVADYFGSLLSKAGYAHHGTETLYSGITGEPLHVDIFIGVVYYQRLRHMVSDKSQARATGPINELTRQPVKGRKKHGGIRFGEMERDSLLAHGAAFLLHDRLHNSSDRHIALVCKACGSMLSTYSLPASATVVSLPEDDEEIVAQNEGNNSKAIVSTTTNSIYRTTLLNFPASMPGSSVVSNTSTQAPPPSTSINRMQRVPMCRNCGNGNAVVPVPMPYVLRYLANEIAAMGIRIELNVGQGEY